MTSVQSFVNGLISLENVAFPEECWQDLVSTVKSGGLQALTAQKAKFLSCLSMLAAYCFSRLRKPVIGATPAPGVENEQDKLLAIESALSINSMPMGGFLDDFLARRAFAWAVSYAISLAEDTDRVQEVFDEAMDWLRNYLDGDDSA